jgi:hypothetical protein
MAEEQPNTEQLRAQAALLLSQARGESFDIQRALGAVSGGSALHARLAAAAAKMSDVASELSSALGSSSFALRATDLTALQDVVQSGETESLLTEASAQEGRNATRTAAVAAASAETRREVQDLSNDVFSKRIFDSYLRFTSPQDEEDFRKREAETQTYINQQLARGNAEGNLNAGGGMIGEMLDMHAHGAGASAAFMPSWNALVEKTEHQRAAMVANGQSTEEYDRNLKDSVRRFLKSKGLTDAEIDQRLSASANPLDAVKPYLAGGSDARTLENQIPVADHAAAPPQSLPQVVVSDDATIPAATATNLNAISAKLKAHGVQMSDNSGTGHGLAVQKPAGKDGPSIAG